MQFQVNQKAIGKSVFTELLFQQGGNFIFYHRFSAFFSSLSGSCNKKRERFGVPSSEFCCLVSQIYSLIT
jgi:hypothetical protein